MWRPAVMWSQGRTSSCGAVPGHVPVGVEALGVHRVDPAVEREVLAPLLERAARAPHALDDPADPAVAAARDALGERRRRVVPLHLRARALGRVAQQRDLAPQLVDAVLPEPLERRVRLRHEATDRHRAARLLRVLAADVDDVLGELGDAERVFVHLGRQPGEEVELHPPPTLRVRGVDRGVEVVFEDRAC